MSSLIPINKKTTSTLTIKRKTNNNNNNSTTITSSNSNSNNNSSSINSSSIELSTPTSSSSSSSISTPQSSSIITPNTNNNRSFSLFNQLISSSQSNNNTTKSNNTKYSKQSIIIKNNNNINESDNSESDSEEEHEQLNEKFETIEQLNQQEEQSEQDEEEEITNEEILQSTSIISKLSNQSIYRINSGQVIISLTSVIKELIENSLDASSTLIEIKFTNYGLECIEVSDNGIGISKNNFENLVKKNSTSKLINFTDLESVSTFGFRGEALSSISCMSELQIFTKTENDKLGNLLCYDNNQNITKMEQLLRSKNGTTIKVFNLFKNFPVRLKELTKNIKREFSKCINIVYSYSLINNISFIVSNNYKNNNNENIFTSHGKSLKDNYVSIFGLKDFKKLQKVEIIQNNPHFIKIEGFISLPEKGCGRSSNDRQYLYVNNRPIDNIKISKCINEMYKEYNRNQYPIYVLNITINSNHIDINITPDKRTIIIICEQGIIDLLKYELNLLLDPNKRIYNLSSELSPLSINSNHSQQSNEKTPISLQSLMINNNNNLKNNNLNNNLNESKIINDSIFDINNENNDEDDIKINNNKIINNDKNSDNIKIDKNNITKNDKNDKNNLKSKIYDKLKDLYENESSQDDSEEYISKNKRNKKVIAPKRKLAVTRIKFDDLQEDLNNDLNVKLIDHKNNFKNISIDNEIENNLLNIYKNVKKRKIENSNSNLKNNIKIKNIKNENETKRTIKKQDFLQMQVIGQFNKSFILTIFRNDLYILDQHACDEKYNYEQLKKETKFNTQPLINPIKLSLTISQQLIVKDYLNLFEKNGFIIKILNKNININMESNENQEEEEYYLHSLPHSKNITFNVDDLEEYISKLNENENTNMESMENIRPSKVDKIFASRACRKSTMFGDRLTLPLMDKIVKNLNLLEHPWNCPHGRATMRALANLNFINNNNLNNNLDNLNDCNDDNNNNDDNEKMSESEEDE